MKSNQKGFTLIELMIVIAIIGILASVALPAYREYIVTSKLGTIYSSVGGVQRAVDKEFSRKGATWITTAGVCASGANSCFVTTLGMPAAPAIPDGTSAVALVAPAAQAGTCAAGSYAADIASVATITIAGADVAMTTGAIQITLDNSIDAAFNANTITIQPQPTATGIVWRVISDMGDAADSIEMEALACRWLSENINDQA